jgi:MtN3 and saliva related transmembrane protein
LDWATVFGSIASVLTSIRFVPQAFRTWRTKKTRDLSRSFLYIVTAQSVFLMLYGFTRPDNFVLYMNILPLFTTLYLLYMKHKYH